MDGVTVRDLISMLETADPDSVVRIAHQPAWPLAEDVRTVVTPAALVEAMQDDDVPADVAHDRVASDVVWLVAGGAPWDASPYAPREVWAVEP